MRPDRGVVRGLGLASVAVLLAGFVAILVDEEAELPPAGARVIVDGRATVVHLDGSTDALRTGDVVRAGEEVRAEQGTMVLELAAGGLLEGRAGDDGRDVAATRVVVGAEPELVAGELLVVGGPGLAVEAAGTEIALTEEDAAARIGRGLSVVAASYRGGLDVDSAGQRRAVPALRQLGIATLGRPPRVPEPLDVRAADPWDRRFLGAAIDLGRSLDAASLAFTANAPPGAATSVVLYETVLPRLADESGFAAALRATADRTPGETLVAAAIAMLARGGSFAERWDATLEFRDDGADWGLVALDRGVAQSVLAEVEAALGRGDDLTEVAAPATPSTSAGPSPTATTAPPTTSATPTTEPPTTPTTPPTSPPAPTVPPLLPLPVPSDDGPLPETGVPLLDDLVDPIEELLGGLLD